MLLLIMFTVINLIVEVKNKDPDILGWDCVTRLVFTNVSEESGALIFEGLEIRKMRLSPG